jgi:hypothetical protein
MPNRSSGPLLTHFGAALHEGNHNRSPQERNFLTAEREDFVNACVLLKAEIVNPGAPLADQYSWWDELTGLHPMIRYGFSPLGLGITFVTGGPAPTDSSARATFCCTSKRLLQGNVPE